MSSGDTGEDRDGEKHPTDICVSSSHLHQEKQELPLTFELVCVFVSDQSDAADVELFEDDVDVSLHRVERQVTHERRERGLRRQLLLLPGASGAATASTGPDGGHTESIMGYGVQIGIVLIHSNKTALNYNVTSHPSKSKARSDVSTPVSGPTKTNC